MKKVIIALISLLFVPFFTNASIDSNLYYGLKNNDDVTELQEFLISKGFLDHEPTGSFLSLTLNAVKAYQTSVGIQNTGYVGNLSRQAINAELASNLETSNTQAVSETGTTLPVAEPQKTNNDIVKSLQDQIALLLQQVTLLQTQQTTTQQLQQTVQQQSQTIQQQQTTLTQIQQNTQQIAQNTTQTATQTTIPAPTLEMNDGTIALGTQGLKIRWNSSNTESCTASGNWSGIKATSGEESLNFSNVGKYSYALNCTGKNGDSISKTSVFDVVDYSIKIDFYLDGIKTEASSANVSVGTTHRLTWSAQPYISQCNGARQSNGLENLTFNNPTEENYKVECVSTLGDKASKTIKIIAE